MKKTKKTKLYKNPCIAGCYNDFYAFCNHFMAIDRGDIFLWRLQDIYKLWKYESIISRYKRRFYNRESKKKCYFANYGAGIPREESSWDLAIEDYQSSRSNIRTGARSKKPKPFKPKGPPDIINRASFRKILYGRPFDYAFLSEFENKILTRRALGYSWRKLARAFSGGHKARSFKSRDIKNMLHSIYDKIRLNERSKSVPLHIDRRKK